MTAPIAFERLDAMIAELRGAGSLTRARREEIASALIVLSDHITVEINKQAKPVSIGKVGRGHPVAYDSWMRAKVAKALVDEHAVSLVAAVVAACADVDDPNEKLHGGVMAALKKLRRGISAPFEFPMEPHPDLVARVAKLLKKKKKK